MKVLVVSRVGQLFFDHGYDGAVIKVPNDTTLPALRAFHLSVERNIYLNRTPLPACVLILPLLSPVIEIRKAKGFINGRPACVPNVLWCEDRGRNNVYQLFEAFLGLL